jgi:hypothetical protein
LSYKITKVIIISDYYQIPNRKLLPLFTADHWQHEHDCQRPDPSQVSRAAFACPGLLPYDMNKSIILTNREEIII